MPPGPAFQPRPEAPPVIFVDTSYWIAAATEGDAHHDEARRLSRSADALLVTTNHVRGETWTFLNRRHGHGAAVAFPTDAQTSDRFFAALARQSAPEILWRGVVFHPFTNNAVESAFGATLR